MCRFSSLAATVVTLGVSLVASAEPGDEGLRDRIQDRALGGHWIYEDFSRAQAEARQTGKPLLVLFRCVPCQCAQVLDEQVTREESELAALEKQFVCVRLVHMQGVDLHYFQFDRDLSFAVLLMNADGTIYGRYGTRATMSRTEATHISLPSFRKALERALDLHRGYPGNQALFAAKRAVPGKFRRAEEMPEFAKLTGQVTVQNCIHCHMAGQGEVAVKMREGQLSPSDIWVYPLPENVGLQLDQDDGLLVNAVLPNTPAAEAGLRPGDQVLAMNGQPLVSQGDVQWVLHHLPTEADLVVQFQRGGQELEKTLKLRGDWRRTEIAWRDSLTSLRPGLYLRPISSDQRRQNGIAADSMALGVHYVLSEAAQKSGLRTGDVIVAIDGQSPAMSEGDFLIYSRLTKAGAGALQIRVQRKGEQRDVALSLKND